MDITAFWALVETSKTTSGGETRTQLGQIAGALSKLPLPEIEGFQYRLTDLLNKANKAELWGACALINGYLSEDLFLYFRAWLVAQGQQVYGSAVQNPDSLCDTVSPGKLYALEDLLYVAVKVYDAVSRTDYLHNHRPSFDDAELIGSLDSWVGDDGVSEVKGQVLYPRLWKKFRGSP